MPARIAVDTSAERPRDRQRLPRRRTVVKVVHWSMAPLIVWFILVTPEDVRRIGPGAVRIHSILGLAFVSLALAWTGDTMRRGLMSRPGPKLPGWGRILHRGLHWALIVGLFGVALGGLAIGITSTVQLWAGGIVPIGVSMGLPQANAIAGRIHVVEFYVLAGLVVTHAAFHIWRHVKLRDNALRIMAPKALHRYL